LPLYEKDSLNIYRWYRRDDEKSYKMLDGNIGYVTLKNIKEEDIPIIKDTFQNTKGIIIDIRNYPSTFVPFSLGGYFVSDTTAFVKFTGGNVNNPGEFTFTELLSIPNQETHYKGKLIVIVNEFSQSQAEYTAMAFRAGDNTTIIGSTTAGADGNVSAIHLPGGLRTMISGIGVYYPDGTETQRVGIVPDIEVLPTIEGIRKGEDEVLMKAIELINNQ
jgi:C-terminal processing protease CtpA/Prc